MSNAQRKARKKSGVKFEREPKRPTTKYIPKSDAQKARRAAERRFQEILEDAASVIRKETLDDLEKKR